MQSMVGGIALGVLLLAASCRSKEGDSMAGSATAVASASAGGDSSAGVGGGHGAGGSLSVVGAGGGTCEPHCSADLKKVVGCDGQIVAECGSDQACMNAACGDDPCAAADAAKSSYGCDYWAVKPDVIADVRGACFAVFVANTWTTPVHLSVSRSGETFGDHGFMAIPKGQGAAITYEPYDPVSGLPPGEVAILFLAHESPSASSAPSCPVPAAVNAEVAAKGTARGRAFHLKADRPVVAYSILPYGGGPSAATSASLLLPTSAWDTNYIAVNAYKQSTIGSAQGAAPSLDVVAFEDGTEVTILPKTTIYGTDVVSGSPIQVPVTYQLDAGEYVQITQAIELTGSPIQSNHPIGLWGGATCLNVLPHEPACDSAHQQIPPVKALGTEYAFVRYRNRNAASSEEATPWRLVGAVNGTALTWQPSTPPGAPTTLAKGQVYEFIGPGPYLVSSQDGEHPFYAAQYMTGATHISPTAGEGDPEWVNVIPTAQFLDGYVFFTDPTYPETNLVVVRKRSTVTKKFEDVTLECAGTLGGWLPVGSPDGDFQYTRVDLVTGDFVDVGACSNGIQRMSSAAPFGVTVWGWGGYSTALYSGYVSYAYPAGASVQPINDVVVLPSPN